ncbi:probable 2-oxoglutarate-dependent dioxygenase AOP1 [Phoenix dactylifera]|uniref:2-oxoglutarate-dependent dioxygenase DAO n=1 Tax=Phoenix dactylifera TaxID=42345 RepID=A0A8B7C6Z1_PHODC|nr:probable 2-oxoglutarate-dependent dioxygenase AOP1 [Phoenix dactylifera]
MGAETAASERRLSKIDFSDVNSSNPGTRSWAAVRARVMQAMESDGCFEAVYPRISSELRDSLFGTAMKELFALPLETKLQNICDKPFHGYLGQIPYLSYESLAIMDAPFSYGAQSFTSLMWPSGNSTFCETVQSFSEQVMELEETVRRMVLESLGVEKYCVAQTESTRFLLRVSEYGAPQGEEEKKLGLVPHRDKNTLAIVCQNQVDGLEIETKDGEWIPATPSPASFIVIAGDAFRAWTNGRVYSPLHRIVVGGDTTRYSAIIFSIPKDEVVIQAPPELVDEEHPSLFRPFLYNKYVHYCVSEEGMKVKCQLDSYCGVDAENLEKQGDEA